MLLERFNEVHWTWIVALEMFVAGVAGGAYVTAAILEVSGRGRSAVARAAHLIPFPLIAVATLLLILDLERKERFWHMAVMNEVLLPMFKPWSPMSLGTWLVMVFTAFAFISFLDVLVARRLFGAGGWRHDRTLHGSPVGVVWSIVGALLGMGVGIYSGVLLSVSNIPGWGQSPLLGAVYVATAMSTGSAAVILVQALAGEPDADLLGLVRTNAWLIGWWLLLTVAFLVALPVSGGAPFFLAGVSLVAIIGAIVLAGVLPLLLQLLRPARSAPATAFFAFLVLAGGFLLRYGLVLGPQMQMR